MKLFGYNKKTKEPKFRITEPDRDWVEDNFKWLIKVYGYPSRQSEQILITNKFFPKTFSTSHLIVQNLIDDLCNLLGLDSSKIAFGLHEDLRDVYGMPFEIQGKAFETETEVTENHYKIHIAKSISKRPNRLIFSLIYEFIKIRLIENKLQYDTGDDTSLFIFIAGIYFGFGIPLSQNLTDRGRIDDGFWETKWNYVSEMPYEVMTFGLATFSKLIEQENPDWKYELPQELRLQFEGAIAFLNDSPSTVFSKAELDANDLFNQADKEYQNGDFDSAITTLQKILFLTEDEMLKADVYNNIGYYELRSGEYEKSIQNFHKAFQINPNYGFAHDNLGYSLIQTGQLEEGKLQLQKALKMENNDNAYTYRNLALYYLAKRELEQAELNFQLAFENETVPVDLLELHYANFLIHQGKTEMGMKYLENAVEKGEPEAIIRMNEIKKN
ncbi:tetratricopeptide repeat protein [Nonlabens xiamenensis]|uniref:tetratricopeptide repeat protein n=1 Tax=Nonlabens xiamenensis TaxID=2341043 RepID=UPI000F612CEA|nr:tetratricopeptide repeat protein [Nonlabens xiamenensis]